MFLLHVYFCKIIGTCFVFHLLLTCMLSTLPCCAVHCDVVQNVLDLKILKYALFNHYQVVDSSEMLTLLVQHVLFLFWHNPKLCTKFWTVFTAVCMTSSMYTCCLQLVLACNWGVHIICQWVSEQCSSQPLCVCTTASKTYCVVPYVQIHFTWWVIYQSDILVF